MLVSDILKTKRRSGVPLGVPEDGKLKEAIAIMVENDTGSCVVTDPAGKLCGMLTFREVLEKLHADPSTCVDTPVKDAMDKDPAIATPEDTVDQIRNIMTSQHIRYLPVMTEGKLTDVVSFYDVARAVAKQTDFENRMLKQYISDWPDDN